MRKIALIISFMATIACMGQSGSNTAPAYDPTVRTLLSSGDSAIALEQLYTGFEIRLSDPSAKLLSFTLVYDFEDDTSSGLRVIPFQGNKAYIDQKYQRMHIFKDARSNFVTIEHLIFERNGIRFKANSLFVPVKVKEP